eukprot:GHVL01016110.1.p2 GENE.GHVL01016110.1~~GHVL01016110.1.p2  ORF type:complete len:219 (+),score=34.37 GHVL01016110.1:665-1321(+)
MKLTSSDTDITENVTDDGEVVNDKNEPLSPIVTPKYASYLIEEYYKYNKKVSSSKKRELRSDKSLQNLTSFWGRINKSVFLSKKVQLALAKVCDARLHKTTSAQESQLISIRASLLLCAENAKSSKDLWRILLRASIPQTAFKEELIKSSNISKVDKAPFLHDERLKFIKMCTAASAIYIGIILFEDGFIDISQCFSSIIDSSFLIFVRFVDLFTKHN